MRFSLAVLALFLFSNPAHAKGDGSRSNHRVGFTVGLFSDPFPNMVGASLRVNLTDFFQIHAGYGNLSLTSGATAITTTALGGGARLFIPGWSLSPYAGFTYTHWSATGNVTLNGQTINAGSGLPGVMYLTFGLDWQTYGGFNVGGGVHYILGPVQLSNSLSIAPNLYLGWYF